MDSYLTREKLRLLGDTCYDAKLFKQFASEHIQSFKMKTIYELGLEVKTTEWLMDMFKDISHSGSILNFFKCVDKLINRTV